MKPRLFTALILCLSLLLFSCTTTRITGPITPEKTAVSPKATRVAETFEGIASWYGPEFHGKKTASGEIFDMTDFTAAHKTLPLGTTCIVTNKRNNKSVTVRINDRGPFAKERVIDLSYAAAKVIGMIETGTAPVRVEVLAEEGAPIAETGPVETPPETTTTSDAGSPTDSGPIETTAVAPGPTGISYTVQVGSFSTKTNAQNLSDTLSEKYRDVTIEEFATTETTYWRVRVGKFATRSEAEDKAEELTKAGYSVFITER